MSERSDARIEIDVGKGEASALLPCRREEILEAHGFDRAWWVALDEGPVEKSISLVGHRRGRPLEKKWKVERLALEAPEATAGRTDDAETLARWGDWIYVLGSHFGAKDGPLKPKRAFVARFCERAIRGKVQKAKLPVEIVRRPFALHRAVNDALARSQVDLIPLGTHVRRVFIEETLERGHRKDKRWAPDLRVEDWPINVEGLAFESRDTAVLGLRFPVTADGHPLLLRVAGLERLFSSDTASLRAELVGWIAPAGERGRACGVRALQLEDGVLHALTGPIGSLDKDNAVVMDYPGSRRADCEHWQLAWGGPARGPLRAERVQGLGEQSVEGLAPCEAGGPWHYAVDAEGSVRLLVPQAG